MYFTHTEARLSGTAVFATNAILIFVLNRRVPMRHGALQGYVFIVFFLFDRLCGSCCSHNVRLAQSFTFERFGGKRNGFFNIDLSALCFAAGDVGEMDSHQMILGSYFFAGS